LLPITSATRFSACAGADSISKDAARLNATAALNDNQFFIPIPCSHQAAYYPGGSSARSAIPVTPAAGSLPRRAAGSIPHGGRRWKGPHIPRFMQKH
jgi:hypothetical protein